MAAGKIDIQGEGGESPRSVCSRYESSTTLGEGGMGTVFAVQDRKLGREVAMKVVRAECADSPRLRERFLREARVQGRLEHPCIAPVHDIGEDCFGRPYFTMKQVRGQSLEDAVAALRVDVIAGEGQGAFPLAERLQVLRKVCDAVAYAHSQGIIHRDLKPANIMIGAFGEVQVMDWGLAKDLRASSSSGETEGGAGPGASPPPLAELDESSATLTLTPVGTGRDGPGEESTVPTMVGEVIGTPRYMAPEQARGEIHLLDERTDVYSLGAILYALLCLQPPPPAPRSENGATTPLPPSERVQRDAPLVGKGLRPPADLDAVALKALSADPCHRYQSAAELGVEIDCFLMGQLVSARHYSLPRRVSKWMRRHWWGVAVGAAAAVLTALGLVGAAASATHARERQVLRDLAPFVESVGAARDDLERAQSLADQGELDRAASLAGKALAQHDSPLEVVEASPLVKEHRPELLGESWRIRSQLAAAGRQARRAWAQALLDSLESQHSGGVVSPQTEAEADAAFDELAGELDQDPALPVAELALHLARAAERRLRDLDPEAAEAADAWRDLAHQVARAWRVQPDSEAAGEALLLLADAHLRQARTLQDLEQVVNEYHVAGSIFSSGRPGLVPRCLLGMAGALLALPQDHPVPFAPEVPAHRMALRCVLQLVTPSGQPTAAFAATLRSPGPGQVDPSLPLAQDILAIARRTAVWTPVSMTLTGRRGRPGQAVARDLHAVRWYRLTPPASPGLAPPSVEEVRKFDDRYLMERAGVEEGWIEMCRVEDGGDPDAWVQTVSDSRERRLHRFGNLDSSGPVPSVAVPVMMILVAEGDLDGDGISDVATGSRHGAFSDPEEAVVRVLFGDGQGGFRDPVHAEQEPDAEGELRRSRLRELKAVDLDGDGCDELVVCRAEWQHFDVEVWEVGPDRKPRLGGALRIGRPFGAVVVDSPGGRFLYVSGGLNTLTELNFRVSGVEMATGGRLLAYGPEGLAEVPVAWAGEVAVVPAEPRGRDDAVCFLELEGETRALQDRIGRYRGARTADQLLERWRLWEGNLPEPEHPRARLVGTVCRSLGGGFFQTQAGVTRRLEAADLHPLVGRAVPWGARTRIWPEEDLELASLLLEFRQPAAALEVLDSREADGHQGDAGLAAATLRIQALDQSGDGAGLARTLQEMAPRPDRVALLLDATDRLLSLTARRDVVVSVLQAWAGSRQLPMALRARIERRLAPLLSGTTRIATSGLEISGNRIRLADGQVRPLSAHWVGNSAGVLQVRESTWRMAGTHWAFPQQTVRFPPSRPFWQVMSLYGGVPVQITGPELRVEVDLETPGVPYNGGLWLGLTHWPLRDDWRFASSGCNIEGRGGGNAETTQFSFLRGMSVSGLQGCRLRWTWEHIASAGVQRLIVQDLDRGEVIACRVMPFHPKLALLGDSAVWLLGIANTRYAQSQVTVNAIRVAGDVKLLEATDPAVERAWVLSPWVREVGAARRAELAGDLEGAAKHLDAAAACLLPVDPTLTPVRRDSVERCARRLRIEAAWLASHRASPSLDALPPEVTRQDVVSWALLRPQPDLAAWAAAGSILAGMPSQSGEDLPPLQRLALRAAEVGLPPGKEGRAALLDAVLQAYTATGELALAYWLVAELDPATAGSLPDEARITYERALDALLSREDLLEVAQPGDGPQVRPVVPHILELSQAVLERQREFRAQEQAEAARLGIGPDR